MTPQEKAKELVDRYYWTFGDGYLGEQHIQCALIAVNEIIESRKDDVAFNDTMWENASEYYKPHPMYLNYWLQVKIEIEKL